MIQMMSLQWYLDARLCCSLAVGCSYNCILAQVNLACRPFVQNALSTTCINHVYVLCNIYMASVKSTLIDATVIVDNLDIRFGLEYLRHLNSLMVT